MKFNHTSYVKIAIQIEENEWDIGEQELFELVIRKNKKRSFLFASTVLGKYIAVHPYRSMLVSMILAEVFKHQVEKMESSKRRMKDLLKAFRTIPSEETFRHLKNEYYELNQKTLFIGFAETATALGHGVFSQFKGDCTYLHTTRMPIVSEMPTLFFEEEHSHAVSHTCYAREIETLDDFERIVLVDDEITTGKTALNLIRKLTHQTNIKEFVVMSLLDWRRSEDHILYERLEEELGICIQCISLLKGMLTVELLKDMEAIKLNNEKIEWLEEEGDLKSGENTINLTRQIYESSFVEQIHNDSEQQTWDEIFMPIDESITLKVKGQEQVLRKREFMKKATGRFGLTAKENKIFEERALAMGNKLAQHRRYQSCLCLGTEEFIYLPCLIASTMGENVSFECSARSPIITIDERDYAIKDAVCFENPEDRALLSYIYNLEGKGYEEVFWFLERNVCDGFKESICKALEARGIKAVHFVICT